MEFKLQDQPTPQEPAGGEEQTEQPAGGETAPSEGGEATPAEGSESA